MRSREIQCCREYDKDREWEEAGRCAAEGALPQYLYGLEVDLNNNVTMSKIELRDPIRYSYVIDADLVMF